MDVSRSAYYDWRRREPSQLEKDNVILLSKIREAHQKSRGTYGSPRVHAELVDDGIACGRNRVAKMMRLDGLKGKQRKRFTKTTDSNHNFPVAPNLLDQKFYAAAPNQVWVSDITYIPTGQGWLYLATVLDLYSRKIVGWSMSEKIDRHLVIAALNMATERRRPSRGLIHHSDRGGQYASTRYRAMIRRAAMKQSMSRAADCYDNAFMESCFGTIKTKLEMTEYKNYSEASREIRGYLNYYNFERKHSSIGYQTPFQFEKHFSLN